MLGTRAHARSLRRRLRRIQGIGDTGATISVTGIRRHFLFLVPLVRPVQIKMGKGSAMATHIGPIEWNFELPRTPDTFYTIPELVLFCEDFRDLTIYSLSSWDTNSMTYVQNSHTRYVVSTMGLDTRFLPWWLVHGDDARYRTPKASTSYSVCCPSWPSDLALVHALRLSSLYLGRSACPNMARCNVSCGGAGAS